MSQLKWWSLRWYAVVEHDGQTLVFASTPDGIVQFDSVEEYEEWV